MNRSAKYRRWALTVLVVAVLLALLYVTGSQIAHRARTLHGM